MGLILYGKPAADKIDEDIRTRVRVLEGSGIKPLLAVIRCSEDPSDISYENAAAKKAEKLGIQVGKIKLSGNVSKEELIRVLRELNDDPEVHGVLMLRPLPAHLKNDQDEICNTLLASKDVDCMTDISNAGVYEGRTDTGFAPCTPGACMEILKYYNIGLVGKNAVVIGRSMVVGRPAAMMLMAADATVTVCHTRTADIASITKKADIIITSAGVPGSLTKDHVSAGQTVIDVSINWDPLKNDGKGGLTGDCRFEEVAQTVDAVTPVPGGVGAVTTSVMLEHVVTAAERTVMKSNKQIKYSCL